MSYFGIPIRNGLPIGLGSVAPLASGGGSPFSPLSLFSGGAPGAWYDPSDYTTLFQDSAGTTPVTAVEQPVGLMLDKSQGLVLGSELVTNGDFSNGTTGWVSGTSLSSTAAVVSGEMQVTATASSGRQLQGIATTTGKSYKVTGLIRKISGGGVAAYLAHTDAIGSSNFSISNTVSGSVATAVTLTFTATASTSYIALSCWNSGDVCGFDNISVKELPGNHAFQATSASRPVLSARYNLLTKTEQFDDAAWSKVGVSSPNASTVTATAGGGFHYVRQIGSVSVSTSISIEVKRSNNDWIFIGPSDSRLTYFNTLTGTFGTLGAGAVVATPILLADGYWKISIETPAYVTSNLFALGLAASDGGGSFTANGTETVLVRKASLVPANQSTLPYQRVNTATDYATTGFLPYLKFDGVDDSLSTNSISFTSTDKMSVFAGVRKLSDAALGMLVELSVDFNTNNGSWFISAPNNTTTGEAGFALKGTLINAASMTNQTFNAPATGVLTGMFNIAASTRETAIIGRLNGADETLTFTNTNSGGTGNFGNYPLYIGRRNNASLPFNGQLYSMVIVGKAVTAGELSSTETWVNGKTGAYA